jgi:hypothetical protein
VPACQSKRLYPAGANHCYKSPRAWADDSYDTITKREVGRRTGRRYGTLKLSVKTKPYLIVLISTLSAFLLFPQLTFAHPGRTDANGGHTCRTNCESWGLQYGEYHYHGGGGGGSNGSTVDTQTAPVQESVIIPTNISIPTRIPTRLPTRTPTRLPSPTVTVTPSPTASIQPTKKAQPIQANVVAQKQEGIFDWLFRLLGFGK